MSKIVKTISLFTEVSAVRNATTFDAPLHIHVLWDTNIYGGTVEVYFEAVFKSGSTANTSTVQLFSKDGTAVTGSDITTTSTTPVRVRSGDIAANLVDDTEYEVRFKSSATTNGVTIYAARLVIIQSGTITATETQVEIGASRLATVSTTYIDFINSSIFYYDSSKYDGTVNIFFEAVLIGAATRTMSAQLIDSDNNVVASSEVTLTSATMTRVRSAAITLVNGKEYRVQIKTANAGYNGYISGAKIIIQQTNSPTKTESYIQIRTSENSANSSTPVSLYGFIYWDNDEWIVSSKNAYHEVVAKTASTNRAVNVDLNDGATNLDTLNSTSTVKIRLRSGAITPVDNSTYDSLLKSLTAVQTTYLYGSRIIVQSDLGAAPPTIKEFIDSGVGVDSYKNADGVYLFSEAGVGVDLFKTIGAIMKYTDSGAGADVYAKFMTKIFSDSGSGADVWIKLKNVVYTDSGSGLDGLKVDKVIVILEDGLGADLPLVDKVTTFLESGAGLDDFLLKGEFLFKDYAVGVDVWKVAYPYPRHIKKIVILIRDLK